MTASFASKEWAEALGARLDESARVRTESMSWVFGPLTLVVDADDELGIEATALRLDLHEGSCRGITRSTAAAAAVTPFELRGTPARWKSILAGELSMVDAVLDSRLRAAGDLPTLARHRGLLDAIAEAASAIETEWPEPATA
jgi:putative sterol carrier protein